MPRLSINQRVHGHLRDASPRILSSTSQPRFAHTNPKMASNEDLGEIFNASELTPEISRELKSIIDLYSIDAQELFYKWESYSMKMGAESTTMDLKTVREFRKDLYEQLERDRRGKPSMRAEDKRRVASTPKVGAGTSDVFGM